MKIAIVGTKGIPAIYGGFETFAFHLAKHLSERHDITVVNEKSNIGEGIDFKVNIIRSTFNKTQNPLLFYKESLKLTSGENDVVLICGVGGGVFYPVYKKKSKFVTNVDGLEHLRGKYTFLQRKLVFMLQKLATLFSDYLVCDSVEVKKYWGQRFSNLENKLTDIAYGAEIPTEFDESILEKYNLKKNEYYLVVARLVPENNLEMILQAFSQYKGEKKLVIVGNINDNEFSKRMAVERVNVIFADSIYIKPKLDCLRINSFAYIHGHSVGGTNPALLEAMACKCLSICHDNVFNKEVTNSNQLYFSTPKELLEKLNWAEVNLEEVQKLKNKAYMRVIETYTWKKIASQYETLFENIIKDRK